MAYTVPPPRAFSPRASASVDRPFQQPISITVMFGVLAGQSLANSCSTHAVSRSSHPSTPASVTARSLFICCAERFISDLGVDSRPAETGNQNVITSSLVTDRKDFFHFESIAYV